MKKVGETAVIELWKELAPKSAAEWLEFGKWLIGPNAKPMPFWVSVDKTGVVLRKDALESLQDLAQRILMAPQGSRERFEQDVANATQLEMKQLPRLGANPRRTIRVKTKRTRVR